MESCLNSYRLEGLGWAEILLQKSGDNNQNQTLDLEINKGIISGNQNQNQTLDLEINKGAISKDQKKGLSVEITT